ncbi:hypothetical protein FUAX_51170 (plasmid) [Fulvitalea axinellae]|uniref:Uncharacterized protein n=1 Tax=Fulvitalea axinellae TaxID=1182444 RepID=A0AAU9DNC9_9BACT|nr:hypothetical protein FUAX_51170 [Fulvitalea axinellae]
MKIRSGVHFEPIKGRGTQRDQVMVLVYSRKILLDFFKYKVTCIE